MFLLFKPYNDISSPPSRNSHFSKFTSVYSVTYTGVTHQALTHDTSERPDPSRVKTAKKPQLLRTFNKLPVISVVNSNMKVALS